VISVEAWELAGLHSNLRWAWVNLPIRANPSLRQLPDGQWVLQAFRGLELGRFDDRATADRALAKGCSGPPTTLGNAAAAHVWLIVWCRDCSHQVEPDPAEMAARYGAEMPVINWRERSVCSRCGSRRVDMVVSGTKRGADS
jgi:hypothetical protein